ncbi:MAG: Holliday junction branch migration protein RuvA [Thermacetogeniaceae bacterium]
MIAFVRGILKGIDESQVLLDVDGIGYEVLVPSGLARALPAVGQEVEVHTYLYVREDCLQLYGFRSVRDRALFRLLLRAPGIGPKVALSILDTFKGEELFSIVSRGDAHSLQRVPGVGAKSAQRLVLELKGKLDGLFEVPLPGQQIDLPPAFGEASQALLALGYSRQEVETVMKRMTRGQPAGISVSGLVRSALRDLGKGKEE